MISFGAVFRWDGSPVPVAGAESLAAWVPGPAGDGQASITVPGGAVAVRLRRVDASDEAAGAIHVDAARGHLFVGDVRLYGTGDQPHLQQIAKGYSLSGSSSFSRLNGDFALCIWDWRERRLVLARDHFGMRPLYYRAIPGGIAVASDVRPLLAVAPADRAVDDEMALDFLLKDFSHHGRSFFRSIKQVVPAHVTTLDSGGKESRERYWQASHGTTEHGRWDDYLEEWRHHFRTSVADRIKGAYPVAAHLSGGLDSGGIVAAAHEIHAAGPVGALPPLVTLSAVYPDLACDETRLIDDMLARLPLFKARHWDGASPQERGADRMVLGFPGLRNQPGGVSWRDIELVEQLGARVLLAGNGGDELGLSWGVLRDQAAHGALRALARELLVSGTVRYARGQLVEASKGLVPPWLLERVRRRRSVRRRAPVWLGPNLRRIFPGAPEDRAVLPPGPSHVQRGLWSVLGSARTTAGVMQDVLAGREGGAEVRLPFFDRRLVEFVLSIPWQRRNPRGDLRRLQREASVPWLPDSIRRRRKMTFESAISHLTRLRHHTLLKFLAEERWVSGSFVDQTAALATLLELHGRDPGGECWQEWRIFWRIAVFEAWLRAAVDYDPARGRQ